MVNNNSSHINKHSSKPRSKGNNKLRSTIEDIDYHSSDELHICIEGDSDY